MRFYPLYSLSLPVRSSFRPHSYNTEALFFLVKVRRYSHFYKKNMLKILSAQKIFPYHFKSFRFQLMKYFASRLERTLAAFTAVYFGVMMSAILSAAVICVPRPAWL